MDKTDQEAAGEAPPPDQNNPTHIPAWCTSATQNDLYLKAIAGSDLPSGAKTVLIWMAFVLAPLGERLVKVSVVELAKYTKMSRSSVIRHLSRLASQGWIIRHPSRPGQTNTYTLQIGRR